MPLDMCAGICAARLKMEAMSLKNLMALVRSGSHEECGNDEEWMKMIDRGGLWYIKESTYSLFVALEEETRQCLKALSNQRSKCKQEVIKMILSNEDVLFYWTIASADFEIDDEEVHDVLLKMIVELYVTMRGFSYASMWMEKYKNPLKNQHSIQIAYVETCMKTINATAMVNI